MISNGINLAVIANPGAKPVSGYFNLSKPESLRLAMQVILSLVTLTFCIGKIIVHDFREDNSDNVALSSARHLTFSHRTIQTKELFSQVYKWQL
jgi:hypothetical protein